MKYTSTRDSTIQCSFEEAICTGYAPDGGLFVPESIPKITLEILEQWSTLTYPELSFAVLRLFIASDEILDEDLRSVCKSAFEGFVDPDQAVPIVRVGSLHISELFHGPTFCFKDLGMRAVVNLLSYFATKRNKRITLIVSTTGDTGPAAVRAVSDIGNPLLTILVHYPHEQISDFQRKQLTTVDSKCVRVAAFQGGGDDMDRPIKNILSQQDRTSDRYVTGVNSYNIGRPLMQMVHYIWTYLRVAPKIGDPIDFVLPTGAMGNIAGGYMCKKMGLPVHKFYAAVNINDITHRVIQKGEFYKSSSMLKTLSEAINVQVPYNFERLLYYLLDGNHNFVRDFYAGMDANSRMDLDSQWVKRLQDEFGSARVTDGEMCSMLRSVLLSYNYLADPHTAIALCAVEKLGLGIDNQHERPLALLSTASPCKFEEAVTEAIGVDHWTNYFESDKFPEAARAIMSKAEVPFALYKAHEGVPLEETQKEWESIARRLILELESSAV